MTEQRTQSNAGNLAWAFACLACFVIGVAAHERPGQERKTGSVAVGVSTVPQKMPAVIPNVSSTAANPGDVWPGPPPPLTPEEMRDIKLLRP